MAAGVLLLLGLGKELVRSRELEWGGVRWSLTEIAWPRPANDAQKHNLNAPSQRFYTAETTNRASIALLFLCCTAFHNPSELRICLYSAIPLCPWVARPRRLLFCTNSYLGPSELPA